MCFVPLGLKLKVIIPGGSKCSQSQNGKVKMVEDILYFLELCIVAFESSWLGGESDSYGKKKGHVPQREQRYK